MAVLLAGNGDVDLTQISVRGLVTNASSYSLITLGSAPNFTDLDVFLYGYSHNFGDAVSPGNLAYATVENLGVAGIDLTVNDRNLLTGGTVTSGVGLAGTGFYGAIGFNLSVADLMAVARTADQADDLALFQSQLSGNDMIFSGAGNDRVFGAGGADLIGGNPGNDTIDGGDGNDALLGGSGKDRLLGGLGDDLLAATESADVLLGEQGRDTLDGGLGNDRLTGGSEADVFVFARSYGTDRITDFQDGTDRIALVSGARSFADLTLVQVGADVELRLGKATLVIENTALSSLDTSDFSFRRDVSVDALANFIDGWVFMP